MKGLDLRISNWCETVRNAKRFSTIDRSWRQGGCCAAGFQPGPCPLWVKSGKAQNEQMLSALAPKEDKAQGCWHIRFVPILLQKSLMAPAWSDSLVQTRFGVEAGDDGAAQSRPKAAVLFI